jgi:hypothetical protein
MAEERSGQTVTETKSVEVREQLVRALRLDLVGPGVDDDLAEEVLPGWVRPSNWYLTGFLVPSGAPEQQAADADEEDDLGETPENAGLAEENSEDGKAAKKGYFPSSLGLSFLVSSEVRSVSVSVMWGDYVHEEVAGEDEKARQLWRREPREQTVDLELTGSCDPCSKDVPDSAGLQLQVLDRPVAGDGLGDRLPAGTRSVSVFLVNLRPPELDRPDRAFVFQPQLEVRSGHPFVPRPDLRGAGAGDWDEQVADLHYADTPEYATGHGVSADWDVVERECRVVRTAWIPSAQVEKTVTVDVPGATLSMGELGELPDGDAAVVALSPLVARYRNWITEEQSDLGRLSSGRRETAEQLLRLAGVAASRIERGIALLAEDADVLDAFKMANRAVGAALHARLKDVDDPKWRAFQLAYFLLNVRGIADPADPEREMADLLFFPTGGGKTEAYLGLAAFTMVMRRLRHQGEDGGLGGAGVSVIMRYTLRLLTLDQLGRAAGLVCALELERETDPARYGAWPFEIGLWVGKAATPNVMGRKGFKGSGDARTRVLQFQNDPRNKPSPIPLETCPWCSTPFEPSSFTMLPNADKPEELRVVCSNFNCDFTRDRALPIVAVDEPLYRRVPAFLIATVDKFASLPWVGPSGMLLGGSERADSAGFYGAADPGKGKHLASPLDPPDLIIQDELHLIAGPLGTMAGLYEAAIDGLCTRTVDGRPVRPKVIASTATVRQAGNQIQALFGRAITQVFPPQGPDRRDSFFAKTVAPEEVAARLYLGIAAQGRNPKVVLRRTWLALMGAAQRAYMEAGGFRNHDNPADPYMTVMGYFNSLRELGGCRRILEEEVRNTVKKYGLRKRIGEDEGLFRDRKSFSEVVELTSRESTDKVAEARRRLECEFHEKQRVDCAIATNMISVGLDIPRLGLMVVLGQPKTHSEYIQATSRVGRDDERPGLVVTLLNVHKPRDRSHYERFRHYHETFYRSVEVASVTPFAARALDRGFAGALVTYARHADPAMTSPVGAEQIATERAELERMLLETFMGRLRDQPIDPEELDARMRSVQNRVVDLLDSWLFLREDYADHGVRFQYQKYEMSGPKPLLAEMLETDFENPHQRKFRVNRSLRDVEPQVNLFMRDYPKDPEGRS